MPLPDDILKPIPGDNPAGADLRYDPLYDKIKEARREDDDAPQGDWQRERKVADFGMVTKLGTEALSKRSKDLQIAAWLTEALVRREGFPGLRSGLGLLRGLITGFWEQVYPELEDGDVELRAAPLEWVGLKLDIPVRSVPLDRAGHDFFKYKESRQVGSEADAGEDESRIEKRNQLIAEGKMPAEEFDQSFDQTPKPFYKQLVADLQGCLDELRQLDDLCNEKFADAAPSYVPLRTAIEEVGLTAQQLLKRKLEKDPDPVESGAVAGDAGVGIGGVTGAGPAAGGAPRALTAEPTDPADAAARVVGAARFLRKADPTGPAPYLLLRALRWGEVRARGSEVDPRLLEAPTSQARTQLKTLMLDADWSALLEAAENVMATPAGRGWLDLQRYVLQACAQLGSEFEFVARTIRAELRTLLTDLPGLPEMTLMDDLPTAGPSTLSWLRAEGLLGGEPLEGAAADGQESPAPAPAPTPPATGAPDRLFERAMAEVQAGRAPRAIDMLKRELDRETSRRGRFLRQAQLGRVMVEAGLEPVATPLLEELMAQIEEHKLETWEPGRVVAEPMALLWRCLDKVGGDEAVKQALYLRVCRLDPMQAITFGQS